MTDWLRLNVDNGKYTVVIPEVGGVHVLRYGEEWIPADMPGSKMLIAMAFELDELRKFKLSKEQELPQPTPPKVLDQEDVENIIMVALQSYESRTLPHLQALTSAVVEALLEEKLIQVVPL